jgi:hypothetical protein
METIFTEKARKIQLPTRKNMANTQAPSPVKKSPEVKRPEVLRPEDI